MICPNKNDKVFIELSKYYNELEVYQIFIDNGYDLPSMANAIKLIEDKIKLDKSKLLSAPEETFITPNIKPGVAELFEENPDFSSQIYEALGFVTPLKALESNFKNVQERLNNLNDTFAENLSVSGLPFDYFKEVELNIGDLDLSLKNKEMFDVLYQTDKKSDYLKSELTSIDNQKTSILINNKGQVVEGWHRIHSLKANGVKTIKAYIPITPQQKQQAQQLYSQYLEQNPNGSIEEFKRWVSEFNRKKLLSIDTEINNIEKEFENLKEEYLKEGFSEDDINSFKELQIKKAKEKYEKQREAESNYTRGETLLKEKGFETDKEYTIEEVIDLKNLNSLQRKLYNLILKLANSLNIKVVFASKDSSKFEGYENALYDLNKNTIFFNLQNFKESSLSKTFLHELIHGVTAYVTSKVQSNNLDGLTQRQINAVNQLKDILQRLHEVYGVFSKFNKNNDWSFYGLENIDELMAELSNPLFIKHLKKVKSKKAKNLLEKIKEFFSDLFGITKTAFDEVFTAFNDILIDFNDNIRQEVSETTETTYASLSNFITQKSQERLKAIQEVFNSNPELSKVGDVFSYAIYLDTIFPDSKVKDIVYHGSKDKEKVLQEGFKTKHGLVFFSPDINRTFTKDIIYAKVNLIKPAESLAEFKEFDEEYDIEGYINNPEISNRAVANEIAVKHLEKIHILGSKQDIEGFKQFVSGRLGQQGETLSPKFIFEKNLGYIDANNISGTISSTIFELEENISEEKLQEIHTNYVNLMNRHRVGKAMPFDIFKSLLSKYQVYNYKNTYIFGQYDPVTATFITRINSSPSSKELLAEAIPNLVKKGLDFISFVPKDYADKLVRSGYTSSESSFTYDFKGENMQKFAVSSNPNVFKKIFNKSFQQVTSEEIENYNDSIDLKYQPVEINDKLIKKAGKELSSILETYLNQFGITVKDINEIKDKLNIDELGFADLLSKIAYVKDKKDLPPIAGEFIAYMMQYNPLVQNIINELIQTNAILIPESEYTLDINGKKIYNYNKLNKTEFYKYIGNLIAEDLQNKLEGNYSKSLIDKIKELIKTFYDYITNTEVNKINKNIGIISNNILQQNKKLITSSLYKPGAFGKPVQQINIEKALASDKFGASIIYKLSKQGFILTGSTALSEQGTILRPDENPLHDIDWVSPFNRKETTDKFFESYPDAIKVRDIYGDGYVTDSFLIAPEGYSIANYEVNNYNGKIIINSYDVVNKDGDVVGTYRLQKQAETNTSEEIVTGVEGKVIDFFSYEDYNQRNRNKPFNYQSKEGTIIQLANWKDIFKAKLDFARYKDIWDYNRFNPNENMADINKIKSGKTFDKDLAQKIQDLANIQLNKSTEISTFAVEDWTSETNECGI